MTDFIIKIPIKAIDQIKEEYDDAKRRNLELRYKISTSPKQWKEGDRVFFMWRGHIRGMHKLISVEFVDNFICSTTKNLWESGTYMIRDGLTLKFLTKPYPVSELRNWGYLNRKITALQYRELTDLLPS